MQACMFSLGLHSALTPHEWWESYNRRVEYWFLKPSSNDRKRLNQRDLHQCYNNTCKTSKKLYQMFARLFEDEADGAMDVPMDATSFCIQEFESTHRAVIRYYGQDLYLYLVWSEDFSTSLLAAKKFMRGRLVYQRDPRLAEYFVRSYYCACDTRDAASTGEMRISDREEGPFGPGVIPSNILKTV